MNAEQTARLIREAYATATEDQDDAQMAKFNQDLREELGSFFRTLGADLDDPDEAGDED